MNKDFKYEENDIQSKGNAIINALRELNFEGRGHQIKSYLEDCEIAVTNINVPSIADCKAIADKFDVEFYTEFSFGLGIFEID